MSARTPRERWTRTAPDQLNLILWAAWDPIGAGVPLDEYETYVGRIASLLEDQAPSEGITVALSEIRVKWMGLHASPDDDERVAGKISEWYAAVVAC